MCPHPYNHRINGISHVIVVLCIDVFVVFIFRCSVRPVPGTVCTVIRAVLAHNGGAQTGPRKSESVYSAEFGSQRRK